MFAGNPPIWTLSWPQIFKLFVIQQLSRHVQPFIIFTTIPMKSPVVFHLCLRDDCLSWQSPLLFSPHYHTFNMHENQPVTLELDEQMMENVDRLWKRPTKDDEESGFGTSSYPIDGLVKWDANVIDEIRWALKNPGRPWMRQPEVVLLLNGTAVLLLSSVLDGWAYY